MGSKKPLLITTLKVMGAFFVLSYVSIDTGILHGKFTFGKVRSHTLTQFPAIKGSFTTVKVSHVAAPIITVVVVVVVVRSQLKLNQS